MKTLTQLKNQYGTFTNDTSTTNLANGEIYINDSVRALASIRSGNWKWLETVETVKTVSGKQAYQVPNKIRKLKDIYIYVDGTPWMPIIIYDPIKWKEVLTLQLGNGDIPRYVYIQDDTAYFSPIPTTNGNTIYFRGLLDLKDATIADYTAGTITTVPYSVATTGTIASGDASATLNSNWTLPTGTYQAVFSNADIRLVTLTNGATTMTWTGGLSSSATTTVTISAENGGSILIGSGTSWTVPMEGRYIRITDSNTANNGDGFWYKIQDVLSTTAITLQKEYQGEAISAGSATYTIAQVSPVPEAYQPAILYRSAALYWLNQNDKERAKMYWMMYDGGVEAGFSDVYGGIVGQMIEESSATVSGPYIPPDVIYGRLNANNPEPIITSSSFI